MQLVYVMFIVIIIYFTWVLFRQSKSGSLEMNEVIQVMVRSCSRWAVASLQDKSPLVAVLHANYAAGYLWALQDSFTDDQIWYATGVDMVKFQKRITEVQDKATRALVVVCPKYADNLDIYLSKISGES